MERALFIAISVIAIGGALNILFRRNPLHSALSLVVVLGALSALYITLNAFFIATIQIIVYAGAVMVLFVFVIMLLNVRSEEHRLDRRPYLKWLAIPFAGLLLGEIIYFLGAFQGSPARSELAVGTTEAVGRELMTRYLLPFEATSILILIAIIGAVVLARHD